MKKKILQIVSLCLLMVLCLTGCTKADPKKEDYNGTSYDTLNETSQSLANALGSLSEGDMESIIAGGSEFEQGLVQSWKDNLSEAGAFESAEADSTVTKAGKTVNVEKRLKCKNRDMILTITYDYNDMSQPQSGNLDCVYTLGEKMGRAAENTVIGILVVFCILILISLLIRCFVIIPKIEEKFKKKAAAEPKKAEQIEEPKAETVEPEETDDEELVAMIAAAIAAATETSTDDFVVRSIRRRGVKHS